MIIWIIINHILSHFQSVENNTNNNDDVTTSFRILSSHGVRRKAVNRSKRNKNIAKDAKTVNAVCGQIDYAKSGRSCRA
jgi:hypothetical protein